MYKTTAYTLSHLLREIEAGKLALPDIQRPFVWKPAQVRDLFDSLYRGFPVGTLMLWETGAEVGTKQVGGGATDTVPKLLIIDGQQRLTSLYSVIKGAEVLTDSFEKKRIRVAFRPTDQTFEVTDAAILGDAEFIPDITELWRGRYKKTVQAFLERLQAKQEEAIGDDREEELENRIDRVRDLRNFSFQVIEMSDRADEEEIAEVFTRINSKGISLNQADFILTLLSVHWEQGRRDLEAFCRAAKDHGAAGSPANPFIEPSPDQMLRVAVGLAFRRGRMQTIYQLLRGKDLETGVATPERRREQFDRLQRAQRAVLDRGNWRAFLRCLRHAGFHGSRVLSSANALLYSYLIWLIGRNDFGMDRNELQSVMARWFFMAHTTGRYTSSPETVIETDLRRLDLPGGNGDAFRDALDSVIRSTFTKDYWEITFPSKLDGTAAKSPSLSAYWAALALLDAEVLYSDAPVSDLLHPDRIAKAAPERKLLFPAKQLEREGRDWRQIYTIANLVFAEWPERVDEGSDTPAEVREKATRHQEPEQQKRQAYWHALPPGWEFSADYPAFLEKRRRLMAQVVRDGFENLSGASRPDDWSLDDLIRRLIRQGESETVEFKSTARVALRAKPVDFRKSDSRIKHAIAKTVCGFMNNEGGALLIGVADDREAPGIDEEMAHLTKPDRDGYELMVRSILRDHLSFPVAHIVKIRFGRYSSRTIGLVQVGAAPQPVFSKPPGGGAQAIEFWVRSGGSTVQLFGVKMFAYISDHFG